MLSNVIEIRLCEELRTRNQNLMRARMHMAIWKAKHRKATEENDWDTLDYLDRMYKMVGLP